MAGPLRRRTAILSAVAAVMMMTAVVLDAGRRGGPARLLTWSDDGSISADTVRDWRKQSEARGAFPVPDNSFFDATNSDIWSNKQGESSDAQDTSWLKPGKWVADRRGSGSQMRDAFSADAHSEYQDSLWWPYEIGVQPSQEAKRVREAADKAHGAANSWKDLYQGMVRRYNNPTFDPYMDKMYQRLVVSPLKAGVMGQANGAARHSGGDGVEAPVGNLQTAREAVAQLDREAQRALPALDNIFRDLPSAGLPGSAAFPEKWPADAGISYGVFRKFNPRAGVQGGEDEPKSWENVAAAAANYEGGMPLTLPADGLEPKEVKSHYDWPFSSPEVPLGYVDTHEHNLVQDW